MVGEFSEEEVERWGNLLHESLVAVENHLVEILTGLLMANLVERLVAAETHLEKYCLIETLADKNLDGDEL